MFLHFSRTDSLSTSGDDYIKDVNTGCLVWKLVDMDGNLSGRHGMNPFFQTEVTCRINSMSQKPIYLFALIVVFGASCKRTENDSINNITTADIKQAIARGDTIIEKGGARLRIRNQTKYDTIETALNGTVICRYLMDGSKHTYLPDGRISKIMDKPVFSNDSIRIGIVSDTVKVGGTFTGRIWLRAERGQVLVTAPVDTSYDLETSRPEDGVFLINHRCTEKGQFKFEGEVKYPGGDRVEFDYRYLVQ